MDKKDVMFDSFVRAAQLTKKPDFVNRTMKYKIPDRDQELTKEELTGTALYAGFVDASQHKPNRYSAPKGSAEPEKDRPASNIDTLIFGELSLREQVKDPPKDLIERGVDAETLRRAMNFTQRSSYNAGYRLAQGK